MHGDLRGQRADSQRPTASLILHRLRGAELGILQWKICNLKNASVQQAQRNYLHRAHDHVTSPEETSRKGLDSERRDLRKRQGAGVGGHKTGWEERLNYKVGPGSRSENSNLPCMDNQRI